MQPKRRALAGNEEIGQNMEAGAGEKKAQGTKQSELHAVWIEDYALIGDCETAALVSRDGSIDWLCWPTFSSGACFAALLGTRDHGYWKIAPVGEVKSSSRRYIDQTLIVETMFETEEGEVCVTDFMPPRGRHSDVVRRVRGERGTVAMRMDLAIRFDYGRTVPWVTSAKDELRAVAGPDMVVLRAGVPQMGEGMTTVSDFSVKAGETIDFVLTYGSSIAEVPERIDVQTAWQETVDYWREWTGRSSYKGGYAGAVERSLMTLKAMTYRPTGGIVAAVTCSLPEWIGGERNWDYRYCWLRDTAFTLLVLLQAGYREEALAWRRWLLRAVAGAPDQVQTIYGIFGERDLIEWEADWLPGYENSRPVRIGNGAVAQFQLDVFGEVAATLARTPEAEDDIRTPATAMQASLVDHLCDVWQQPDEGIWEVRGGRQHFTHSKVMAWVAVDRAIRHYELKDGGGDVERWRRVRDQIHAEVCDKGFNEEMNSFVQAYGSKQLDASCLRIVLVGFLPPEDPRIRGTVEAIEKYLMPKGLVLRYNTATSDDGLPPGEGVFLACSFWMVTNLWLIGRKDEAVAMFERLLKLRNDVGLLSEEYDPEAKRMLGNFPQALSHIALVHSAFALADLWKPQSPEPKPETPQA